MMEKAPNWKTNFNPTLFRKALDSKELQELIKKAEKEYVYWDKFRFYNPPNGFTIEEAWAYLKFSRVTNQENTFVRDKNGESFVFTTTKTMFQKLSYIDSNTSGFLTSEWGKPTDNQKNQLIISGLTEEAIASSQIEGANTSRKVAKEMILSQRKPKNRSEQMIINNYQVMQRLIDWKDLDLNREILLEIQKTITNEAINKTEDSGRFRKNDDDIHVVDPVTQLSVYTPPNENIFQKELDRLIEFANKDEDGEDFIHPVIKASIIHFWLAYLHPFVDGNGRTARAIFYWYMLKKNYWVFQYLSISRAIKLTRTQYDNAFLRTEMDDNDLTYFILYQIKTINESINNFISHYEKKIKDNKKIEFLTIKLKNFNTRQISLIDYLYNHPETIINIKMHQNRYQTAYQTARMDLIKLTEVGFLTQIADGNKYIYVSNKEAINKIIKKTEK